jgi:hypothetical protein
VLYQALYFTVAFQFYDSITGGAGLPDRVDRIHSLEFTNICGPGPVWSRRIWGPLDLGASVASTGKYAKTTRSRSSQYRNARVGVLEPVVQ